MIKISYGFSVKHGYKSMKFQLFTCKFLYMIEIKTANDLYQVMLLKGKVAWIN